jgi:hypothetical protein
MLLRPPPHVSGLHASRLHPALVAAFIAPLLHLLCRYVAEGSSNVAENGMFSIQVVPVTAHCLRWV